MAFPWAATVTNQQTATATVDLDQVRDFLRQASTALPNLPGWVQEGLRPGLKDLDDELKGDRPNPSKVRTILNSLRRIAEGAAGNLTAQGIIALITKILLMQGAGANP